ncbi:hypothetical protein PTTW11_11226 [Pyrenophora teres f. teres]|uniref:Uncharacterized protein n=1 Tax=Pyrenophora teres f. teres TaxID=97479 RepID=A0A6S6WHV1_9PLEO|nr:hypothetical protein PTTW11_11226 [Pyrenophora teres f. teres]
MLHKDAWRAWRGNTPYPRQYRKPTIVVFYDMAPIIVSSWPSSPDVARLVQDRLSRVQQQFPACSPNTLSDLRTVVNELSTISKTCDRVLNDIETREEETDVVTAFKDVEDALDWAKFLQYVHNEQSGSEHEFLFRAYRNMTGKAGSFEPAVRNVIFNERLRKGHTVHSFVEAIAKHLGKTQVQKETGVKQETMFTSMSPILEWALHTTKNKWSDNNADERASLVVFDMKRLREIQDVALFRVSDVIRFLESQNQLHLISSQLRDWTRNCDEYVTMGKEVKDAIVRIISWSELRYMPIINSEFIRAYTLGRYCKWRDERNYGVYSAEEVGAFIVRSAKVLAGEETVGSGIARKMMQLIVKPEVSFWGINTAAGVKEIMDRCEDIFQGDMVESMSQANLL